MRPRFFLDNLFKDSLIENYVIRIYVIKNIFSKLMCSEKHAAYQNVISLTQKQDAWVFTCFTVNCPYLG